MSVDSTTKTLFASYAVVTFTSIVLGRPKVGADTGQHHMGGALRMERPRGQRTARPGEAHAAVPRTSSGRVVLETWRLGHGTYITTSPMMEIDTQLRKARSQKTQDGTRAARLSHAAAGGRESAHDCKLGQVLVEPRGEQLAARHLPGQAGSDTATAARGGGPRGVGERAPWTCAAGQHRRTQHAVGGSPPSRCARALLCTAAQPPNRRLLPGTTRVLPSTARVCGRVQLHDYCAQTLTHELVWRDGHVAQLVVVRVLRRRVGMVVAETALEDVDAQRCGPVGARRCADAHD